MGNLEQKQAWSSHATVHPPRMWNAIQLGLLAPPAQEEAQDLSTVKPFVFHFQSVPKKYETFLMFLTLVTVRLNLFRLPGTCTDWQQFLLQRALAGLITEMATFSKQTVNIGRQKLAAQ